MIPDNPDYGDRRRPDESDNSDTDSDNAQSDDEEIAGLTPIEYEHRGNDTDGVTIYNPDAVGTNDGEWITARPKFAHDRDQIQ